MFRRPSRRLPGWQAKVDHDLPLLGHRNWILVVDSAYPLQSSPGVETVETNADQLDVVSYVLGAIDKSIHVRPDIFMDAELPYVQEEDAPGTSAYRDAIAKLLDGRNIESELHEKLIANVDEAGQPGQRARPQDQAGNSLLFRLHPSQLQILGRRRRRTAARQDGRP